MTLKPLADPVIAARVEALATEYGSLTAAAEALGLSLAYLSRLRTERLRPSEVTLRKLGLRRREIYEPLALTGDSK